MPLATEHRKICSGCKKRLPLDRFCGNKITQDGLQNWCKSCKAKINKNWRHALKSGIFEQLVKEQEGKCAICNEFAMELVIDHDHKTNKLRSLLCRKCNSLLGMCDDNLTVLESSISYLKRWTEE